MKAPRRVYRLWLKRTGVGAGEQSAAFGPRMTRPVKSLSQEDFVDHFIVHSDSISFGDELSSLERRTVIVRPLPPTRAERVICFSGLRFLVFLDMSR